MSFKPFPVGTIHGPYTCGLGNPPLGYNAGVQFLVNTKDGWVPFIGKRCVEEAETRQRAEEFAKRVKEVQKQELERLMASLML